MKSFLQTHIGVLFFLALILGSCNTPKYTYMFESGKYMNFGEGKWLINNTKSNSKIFDSELYTTSVKEFRKILGDSLMEINDIRRNRLLAPEISFDLDRAQLLELREQSGCNFLINVTGKIIKEGLGPVSIPTDDLSYYNSNESSVEIRIYQLDAGVEISSSRVYAKLVEQGEISKTNSIPSLNMSAQTAMLSAAKKLIRKYDKYSSKLKGS